MPAAFTPFRQLEVPPLRVMVTFAELSPMDIAAPSVVSMRRESSVMFASTPFAIKIFALTNCLFTLCIVIGVLFRTVSVRVSSL